MKFRDTGYFKDQKKACRHFAKRHQVKYFVSLGAFLMGLYGILHSDGGIKYQEGVSDTLDDLDNRIDVVRGFNSDKEEGEES